MYSFAQRPDTQVVDEPLYGHYLRISGANHPGRDEVLAAVASDGDAVMRELLSADRRDVAVLFLKQMAHHVVSLDTGFLKKTTNVFLIRDPRQMLPSLTIQLPHADLGDTGLKMQCELYDMLTLAGQKPIVIESRQLLLDPAFVLRRVCALLEIEYFAEMLRWPAGPIAEDGIWAKYWYRSVHRSTGFAPYAEKQHFPPALQPLLDKCRPYFDKLDAHAIRVESQSRKRP